MSRGVSSFVCLCVLTMLQIQPKRCYTHAMKRYSPLHRYSSSLNFAKNKNLLLKSPLYQRNFWGWSNSENGENNNNNNDNKKGDDKDLADGSILVADKASNSNAGETKSLVAQFGDSTPKFSPLLVLPLSRRPVFPGFFATHLVKDEKTLEAIIENHKRGISYLGLFLQKDKEDTIDGVMSQNEKYKHFEKEEVNPNNKEGENVITSLDQVHAIGTYAQIHNVIKTARGGQLLLMAHRRIRLEELITPPATQSSNNDNNNVKPKKLKVTLLSEDDSSSSSETTITAAASPGPALGRVTFIKVPASDTKSTTVKAYANEVIAAVRELVKLNPVAQEHIHEWASRMDFSDPMRLADFAASITSADGADMQRVLSASDPEERLSITLELLNKERKIAEFQKEISEQVEKKMTKQQREYMLKEQLKTINKELGIEKDDKAEMLANYQEKVNVFKSNDVLPATVATIQDEIKKLSSLERNSPEFNVVRAYLDWLTSIPFNIYTTDELNITKASSVLQHDHFGLDDVKKQILEFIAVGKLKGTITGKVLCLVGPPGVGKTSIAKSIASALNRKFYRFSVGGLSDMAEVKGHRRTYIGAMPGKPVQILKSVGTSNPVILLDEIDKVGKGHQGDPASALLELLDPNQNNSFVDHYLDIPVDFSHVLFICTANDEGAIPGPLRDRMDVMRLTGYDIPEKVAIAREYLVPKVFRAAGLWKADENINNTTQSKEAGDELFVPINASISDSTLELIIRNYCRESGIRSLEKHIEKIARKIAFKEVARRELSKKTKGEEIVNAEADSITYSSNDKDKLFEAVSSSDTSFLITPSNLEEFLGPPKYPEEALYDSHEGGMPPGVVMGLAWNPLGGSPVFIEAAATPVAYSDTGGSVQVVTGQLGDVMRESVNIAYTFARSFLRKNDPENQFFKTHQLHIHCPEGAVGKDGPSAGVTMATALISLATNTPVTPHVAMTGEISLTGKVLPVGGIKEKILAARRTGANTVVLPSACRRDYQDLPEYVKDSLTVHFAGSYEDVFRVAFKNGLSRQFQESSEPTLTAERKNSSPWPSCASV